MKNLALIYLFLSCQLLADIFNEELRSQLEADAYKTLQMSPGCRASSTDFNDVKNHIVVHMAKGCGLTEEDGIHVFSAKDCCDLRAHFYIKPDCDIFLGRPEQMPSGSGVPGRLDIEVSEPESEDCVQQQKRLVTWLKIRHLIFPEDITVRDLAKL